MSCSDSNISFQRQMEAILQEIASAQKVPTLLLHSCCAPCSSYVLESLSPYFSILDYYYNPNITPEAEYTRRQEELAGLIGGMSLPNPVRFLSVPYDPAVFGEAARGLEDEPEGGTRCEVCFRIRLRESARMAKALGADYFTTSLTISPKKNAALLNAIGREAAEEYGVAFLPSDFKKKGGFLRSCELSKQYGLYRQDFCGCIYSKIERDRCETQRRHEQIFAETARKKPSKITDFRAG